MKLELKHIAPYSPYDIEFILSEKGIFNLDSEYGTPTEAYSPMKIINMIFGKSIEIEIHSEKTNWGVGYVELDEIMPILHPMSSLSEKHFNELSNMIVAYDSRYSIDVAKKLIETYQYKPTHMPYIIIEKLFEWHYDVFELIPENLAIDINTL